MRIMSRKVFKGELWVDAEWLRWTDRDTAQNYILREINRMVDPWFRSLDHETATAVRFRRETEE